MPADVVRAEIDKAIAVYKSQGGPIPLLGIHNEYEDYVVAKPNGGLIFPSASSLKAANKDIQDGIPRSESRVHVGGAAHGIGRLMSITIYAAAAYRDLHPYGFAPKVGYTALFVLWHEAGHLPKAQGGGGCGSNNVGERCANKFAEANYLRGLGTAP